MSLLESRILIWRPIQRGAADRCCCVRDSGIYGLILSGTRQRRRGNACIKIIFAVYSMLSVRREPC